MRHLRKHRPGDTEISISLPKIYASSAENSGSARSFLPCRTAKKQIAAVRTPETRYESSRGIPIPNGTPARCSGLDHSMNEITTKTIPAPGIIVIQNGFPLLTRYTVAVIKANDAIT